MRPRRFVVACAGAAALLVPTALMPAQPASAAPPTNGYVRTAFALGVPDFQYGFRVSTSGNPVNASGLVAGSSQAIGFREPYVAEVYDIATGTTTNIGTLPYSDNAAATDVNDGGDVVGTAGTDLGLGDPTLAFLWTRAQPRIHTLGSLDPLDPNSGATAVSNAGVVVGWTFTPDSGYTGHAFVWDPTVTPVRMRDLGTLGGVDSVAYGINSAGTIVGSATTRRRVVRPVVWSPGTHTIRDIGTLPGYDSGVARDVNDRGFVVGEDFNAADPDRTQAFVWSPVTGAARALSTPTGTASRATAINHHNVVVGQEQGPPRDDGSASSRKAVVWGACAPLAELPGDAGSATGITRQERIVGSSAFENTLLSGTGWLKSGPCT